MLTFHIITLFPESIESYVTMSILGRAIQGKKINVLYYNPRDFSTEKHRKVDAKPYGGGPGMVMQAGPLIRAIKKAKGKKNNIKILLPNPSGKIFTNTTAKKLSKFRHIIIIAGRYEGIDARIKKIFQAEEVSMGSYILTGGEIPAMTIIDAVSRHIPGVLGKKSSLEENRFSSREVYTRPPEITVGNKVYKVPKVLLSGNHTEIEKWREKKGTKIKK